MHTATVPFFKTRIQRPLRGLNARLRYTCILNRHPKENVYKKSILFRNQKKIFIGDKQIILLGKDRESYWGRTENLIGEGQRIVLGKDREIYWGRTEVTV